MEVLDAFGQRIAVDDDGDRLAGLTGREAQRAGRRCIVASCRRGAVRRGVPNRHHLVRCGAQGDSERRKRCAAAAGVLDRRQIGHLVLVDRPPVIGQDSAGVAGIRIPGPERPAHVFGAGRNVDRAVVVEVAREVRGDGFEPDGVLRVLQLGTEFADPDRGDVLFVDVAPRLPEYVRQVGAEVTGLEPGLRPDGVRVVVRGVDDPVGHVERDGPVLDAHQVAAPPVVLALVGADTLDEDQQIGIDAQDCVAGPLGRTCPVGGAAAAPGAVVGLVVQVHPDHRRVVLVPRGQRLPVGDPGVLGVLAVVPKTVFAGARPG